MREMVVAPRMWRAGAQAISLISVLTVNTALTPSQRPLRASLTASVSFLMVRAGETVKAILVAVFSHSRRHVQNCADDSDEGRHFRNLFEEETQGEVVKGKPQSRLRGQGGEASRSLMSIRSEGVCVKGVGSSIQVVKPNLEEPPFHALLG